MKNLATLIAIAILSTFTMSASETTTSVDFNRAFGYGNSYIFVEGGITFSVFPDGEFDFYLNNRKYFGANVNLGNVNISYNSGYKYDAYVQYDDYGAVIQIENTPIYYDFNGRVSRIGAIDIYYNNARLHRVGGLYVYYNTYGAFSHCTGYINTYNRSYVYRPFHRYLARPAYNLCLVNYRPYRRNYIPVRYTYYRPYRNNRRRAYATVGRNYYYRNNHHRNNIYRNDKRVSTRKDTHIRNRYAKTQTRRNNNVANGRTNRTNKVVPQRRTKTVKRTTAVRTPQRNVQRTAPKVVKRTTTVRTPKRNVQRTTPKVVKRTTTVRTPKRNVQRTTPKVVKRTTTVRTPKRTVQRKSTTAVRRSPSTQRRVAVQRSTQRVVKRTPQRTVNRSTTRSTSTRRR